MKYKGSTIDFIPQRNAEIMAVYRSLIASTKHIDRQQIFAQVASSPCSRFWVSEERAYQVMLAITKGRPVLYTMMPTKRDLFIELHHRVYNMRKENPDTTLYDIVWDAVNSPAPRFYMTPKTVEEIINRMKRGYYNKK